MPTILGPLGTGNVQLSQVGAFVPQVWAKDVIVAYQAKNKAKDFFKTVKFTGSGNRLNMPTAVRGQAVLKVPGQAVQIQSATEGSVPLDINKHFTYARLIEDIVKVQALASLREVYTEDAGYQLARQQDRDIFALASFFNGGSAALTYTTGLVAGDGTTLYTSGAPNGTSITDAAIRRTIQRFDESDTDTNQCALFVTPAQLNVLRGITRFTEQSFVGDVGANNTIRTGKVQNVYGVPIMASNNLPTATGGGRVNIMAHKDSIVCAEQMGIRVQTENKVEFLGSLMVADFLYGVACARPGTVDIPTGGYALISNV